MKKFLLLLVFFASLTQAQAQFEDLTVVSGGNNSPQTGHSIAIVPQYALNNTLRFDYQYTTATSGHQIKFLLHYIERETSPVVKGTAFIYSLRGAGIGYGRKFFREQKSKFSIYFAGSITYDYKTYDFVGNGWKTIYYNDLPVDIYTNCKVQGQTHSLQLDFTYGTSVNLTSRFFMEFYIGIGYRYSANIYQAESDQIKVDNEFDTYFDPGYTGIVFLTGLKFGVNL